MNSIILAAEGFAITVWIGGGILFFRAARRHAAAIKRLTPTGRCGVCERPTAQHTGDDLNACSRQMMAENASIGHVTLRVECTSCERSDDIGIGLRCTVCGNPYRIIDHRTLGLLSS